jgi:hypothetical protein
MDDCALRLVEQLAPAATEGRAVDIWRSLGTMTMGVRWGGGRGPPAAGPSTWLRPACCAAERLAACGTAVCRERRFIGACKRAEPPV